MKKYDYRIEGLSAKDFNEEKSIKQIKDFLSQLGSEGWELMEIMPTSKQKEGLSQNWLTVKKCLLFFKKEIE